MNANTNDDERQLQEELRWAKEALAIAEMEEESMSFHGIAESRKECLPHRFRHIAEWSSEDIERHIELLERDIKHAKAGDFR